MITIETTTAAITEAVGTLLGRDGGDRVSIIPREDGGVDIKVAERPLYISLKALSMRLPGNPSTRVVKGICERIRIPVGKIAGKPCVSVEAFKRAWDAYES
jgi:hypothetical protein